MIYDPLSKSVLERLLNDVNSMIHKAGDGLRGKEGSPAVRHFLREVKEKVKRMISRIKEPQVRAIAESIEKNIAESMDGSFRDTEDKVRDAVRAHPAFPTKDATGTELYIGPYIEDIYQDHVVVKYGEKLYDMSYSIVDDVVVLGASKEVKLEYSPVTEAKVEVKESAKVTDIRESGTRDLKHGELYVSLKEAKVNDDCSEIDVILIEAGTCESKKRHYPESTIREAAPMFTGWKMYLNHPTPQEEKDRPERDLRDWVSTITESHYEGGKAMAKVTVHDAWLRERLKDPVARANIGLSIHTGGKLSIGKVNGKDGYQIVEALLPRRKNGLPSVDWVTEAGARGRVPGLKESVTKGKDMEMHELTVKDLKESRPDLVETLIKESAQTEAQRKESERKDAEIKESKAKIAEFERKEKISAQKTAIEAQLKEAKELPEVAKERIRARFADKLVEGDLKEAVTGAIKEEAAYINKFSSKGKIALGGDGQHTDLKESIQADLDKRAGIVEKK